MQNKFAVLTLSPKVKSISKYIILSFLFFAGCKGFKNTPVGKFYHNITGHYNAYFNADEKIKEVELSLFEKTEDNYSNIIAIFPIGTENDAKSFTADLDKCVQRCSKVIKNHDVSNWVDDAYLLCGKSYFYKRDYFAAIETFQYGELKYPETIPGQECMLWHIRCFLDMNKLADAQSMLTNTKVLKTINPKILYKLNLIKADYYIRSYEYKEAAEALEKAIKDVPERRYRLRYYYILGQLYAATGNNKKATENFTQVIRRNATYDLTFQAKMGLAGLYATQTAKEKKAIRKYLNNLIKDTKNNTYLDQVYYQLAKIELSDGNTQLAIEDLKMSSAFFRKNKFQKTQTLSMLGDVLFGVPDYDNAKIYYDSTVATIQKEYPKSEEFKKNRKVFSDLSGHLYTIEKEDSLQKIAGMSEEEKSKVFKRIEEEKKLQEKKKQEEEKNKKQKEQNNAQLFGNDGMENENQLNMGNNNPLGDNTQNNTQTSSVPTSTFMGGGEWYFYSVTALDAGYTDFTKRWGKRPLQDDWRRKKTGTNQVVKKQNSNENNTLNNENKEITQTNTDNKTEVNKKDNNTENKEGNNSENDKYNSELPITGSQKSLSNGKIETALYSAGEIYSDKLDNKDKAVYYFESVISRFPDSKYLLKAHYRLYQIYYYRGDTAKAMVHKDFILKKYPVSEYAILIKNPDILKKKREGKHTETLRLIYEKTFAEFKKNNCKRVTALVDSALGIESNNYLAAKFDYVKLLCTLRNDTSSQKQIDSLNSFIKKYPGNEMSAEAMRLIQVIINRPKDMVINKDTIQKIQRVVAYQKADSLTHMYICTISADKNINIIKAKFSDYNLANFRNENLEIQSIIIDDKTQAVVIKNFADYRRTKNYFETIRREKDFLQKMNAESGKDFYISDQNFSLFMRDKDVDTYLKFFSEKYK